jgi:hypothetical protein
MKLDVSSDENADVFERLKIIESFIDNDLIPIAESELAERVIPQRPLKPEIFPVNSKKIEKRSRQPQTITAEKK